MKWSWASAAAAVMLLLRTAAALADEGGASVWLPGQFASFAAVPGDPGFSLETIIYTRKASASAGTSFLARRQPSRRHRCQRAVRLRHPELCLSQSPCCMANCRSASPSPPAATIRRFWGPLTGPLGGTFSAARSDSATGISDLYPIASLKWQVGSHNFMAYTMASAPVGIYDPNRLAGVGLGHWALDAGMGYTFLSPGGFEFSLTAGMTYNFINPSTQYQSGMDGHVDLGTSYALSERSMSAPSATSTTSSARIPAGRRCSAISAPGLPARARRPGGPSPRGRSRSTSTCGATRNSPPRTGPRAGTPG